MRTGLRSKAAAELAQPLEDNPESILRSRRKGRRVGRSAQAPCPPQSPVPSNPDHLVQSVEALLGENQGRIDYGPPNESPDEEDSSVQEDIDPEDAFNRKWGYLPPLDEEAAAIVDAIIEDPTNAMEFARINPTNDAFHQGLRRRNVLLKETTTPDPYGDTIHLQQISLQESKAERESYERLWTLDRAKCVDDSNEALFQRTLMMSFIARHCLVYGQGATGPSYLDFSVEVPWNCPPMPTGDFPMSNKLLTQPKPDLAVCFRREEVIPDSLWYKIPYATQRLACYEKPDIHGESRAFHFFTIEGKSSRTSPNDITAKYRSLNNASQALHNMFEFFQDAGPGHREKFFSEVRFFSAVASTEGLNIRIHRATQVDENVSKGDYVIPGYPLRFEFREFVRVPRDKLDRKIVLELFAKILVGYGVKNFRGLLQDAANAIVEKINEDPEEYTLRQNVHFYRHGQGGNTPRSSRIPTLTASRGRSVQNPMSVDTERSGMLRGSANMAAPWPNQSFDMLRSRTVMPTQSQAPPSTQVSSSSAKRRRDQLEDDSPQRRTQRPRE